jgi:hypothetical protein
MTNDDDRTELASALLDGTLPDAAAAVARRDPAVMARLAQLEQARERVRDMPPPPIEGRDAMLAAALDAFDSAPPASPVSPVSDLQARRRARGERRAAPRWLGAAAAVALVLAGVGALALLGQGSSDREDQAAVTAADEASGGGEAGTETSASEEAEADDGADSPAEGAPPVPSVATRAAQLGDLGSFATAGDLVARVREDADFSAALSGGADAMLGPEAASSTGCAPEELPGVLQDQASTVLALGSATVDGTAVTVWVANTASGRRVVLVDAGCRTVANRPLE